MVAVELHALDAAIGNHAAAEPNGFVGVAFVAIEPAAGNPSAVHKRALFNGVDAGVGSARAVRREPDGHRTTGGCDVLIGSHGNEQRAGSIGYAVWRGRWLGSPFGNWYRISPAGRVAHRQDVVA